MRKAVFGFCLFVVVTFCYAGTPPETILSAGALSKDALVAFLLANNPRMNSMNNKKFVAQVVDRYIAEANAENKNILKCITYRKIYKQIKWQIK